MSITDHPISLPLLRFRVELTGWPSATGVQGRAIRGTWGHVAKAFFCENKIGVDPCEVCQKPGSCFYSYLFDSQNPGTLPWMNTATDIPRPYLIQTDEFRETRLKGQFSFSFVFIGLNVIQAYHYLVDALHETAIRLWLTNFPYQKPGKIIIYAEKPGSPSQEVFHTGMTTAKEVLPAVFKLEPLELTSQKRVILDFTSPFRFKPETDRDEQTRKHYLLQGLAERILSLDHFYGSRAIHPKPDLSSVLNSIQCRFLRRNLVPVYGFSTRQNQKTTEFGYDLMVELEGDLAPLFPSLLLGSWLHTGPRTSSGWGQYRIVFP
ncbi:MAG: hypothetical protein J0L62_14465 [Bacteroidetes bacterium]|nr:hypothetical protein [Bacteroidota bacterium]